MFRRSLLAALLIGMLGLAGPLAAGADPADPIRFEAHIRPILKAYCFQCHGEEPKPKGKLDLRLAGLIRKGGKSGAAVAPGDHAASLLWERIEADEMPPGEKKLTEAEKRRIADWIDHGAKASRPEPDTLAPGPVFTEEDRGFWSFRPVTRPEVPRVAHRERVRNPIDAFLLAKLESANLGYAPEADRATLVRRLTLDLLGLPPTPGEVEAFCRDSAPDAFERLVDRLLASPHYGERWARHWMDAAGYADSDGYAPSDYERRYLYKYRDYLVRSLNADRPWDALIREQLAGDEMVAPPYRGLSPADRERLAATGFLRTAPDGTGDGGVDQAEARNAVLAETVKIVGTSLLGLTVGCAQCHAHRYDPISHEDYHRIRALFEPALDPSNWRAPSARLISLWTDADRARAAKIDAEAAAVDKEQDAAVDRLVARVLEAELAKAPVELRPKLRSARETPEDRRTDAQKQLIRDYPRIIVSPGNVSLYDAGAHGKIMAEFAKKRAAVTARRPVEDFLHALTETAGKVPVTHRLDRGDHRQPREAVSPGELSILSHASGTPEIPVDDPAVPTTGRRLAYARHLTSGQHPLVARVLVNRIWMHHFGRGIVATPGDFGALGERPSHPELLDWLADAFVRGGWSLKSLHRLIVSSTAYRQSARRDPHADAVDPENRLLAHMPARRLEAEVVRDAILAASGRLDRAMFGTPVPVAPDDDGQVIVGVDNRDSAGRPSGQRASLGGAEFRRTIYIQVRRSLPLGLLEAFDAPAMTPSCDRRAVSTVATQSLLLMNNTFVVDESQAFAARVMTEAGPAPAARIRAAWRLALGRDPTVGQLADALEFLRRQRADLVANAGKAAPDPDRAALASLCQALLGSNAFLYVD